MDQRCAGRRSGQASLSEALPRKCGWRGNIPTRLKVVGQKLVSWQPGVFQSDTDTHGRRPNLPAIFGYSRVSSIPFIVLGLCTFFPTLLGIPNLTSHPPASVLPFRRYLSFLAETKGREGIVDVFALVGVSLQLGCFSSRSRSRLDGKNEGKLLLLKFTKRANPAF